METKYKVGDIVACKDEIKNNREISKVVSISWDSERGFIYKVSSTAIDNARRVATEAIKIVLEENLEEPNKNEMGIYMSENEATETEAK